MSLLLRYNLENGTPTIGEDSAGNSINLTNSGVVAASDPLGNFGSVASFDGSSYLEIVSTSVPTELTGASPRTISFWIYSDHTGNATIYGNGVNSTNNKIRFLWVGSTRTINVDSGNVSDAGSISVPAASWVHFAFTYGSSTIKTYINGVLDIDSSRPNVNTGVGNLALGRDPSNTNLAEFQGFMLDFRAYDAALDLTGITTIYNDGPRDINKVTLEATMYTHLADITWSTISNASSYTLTQTLSGEGEVTILDNSTELLFTTTALVPNTSYTFNLYTDLDPVTPIFTITEATPLVDAVSGSDLATRLNNDFTDLANFNPSEIQAVLKDMFSTQDIVTMSSGKFVFVEDADSINFALDSDVKGVLTPFESSDGAGQNFTLDSSTVNYDETLNQVTIGTSTLSTGGSSIFNGYKVTMKNI